MEMINAIGRRKAAVARVYLKKGDGKITINGKDLKEYFTVDAISSKVIEPIEIIEEGAQYDINVNVKGGGYKGQAEAIRMGISRAFVEINADFKPLLKTQKLLTRDPREVERKKFGKPKARKSFQFSKR
ncbi:MAG: 30S ribosomal protein S9 [Saprospiraceae bacterium]|mgnify:CR=1 FL=1|jgi:small subunit ribosomal protein S9|nr:30S ribosomal protein S9 [Saprospiraceae bacterium]MBK8632978.1 30S ribosomal protein S9 [Saprospiraceae bacterium]